MRARDRTDDLHEWISFEDPTEHRTWVFDATFLRSNYTCIYGAGCQGILDAPAPELEQGCCSYGAHFVDDDDVADRRRARSCALEPRHMQFHAKADARRASSARRARRRRLRPRSPGWSTTRCIFLNRPGSPAASGCALHIAALDAGERPLDWKPDVCWQVPIRLEHSTDENGHLTSRLREWKRRDWGEGGADFHWWCTESPEAFVGAEPLYISRRDDIVELVGARDYATMVELFERPGWVPLPHPAVRRRTD